MLPAGTGEYRSTETFRMCVITLRVWTQKQGEPKRNGVTASQNISTPLIQINVPKPPGQVALPIQCTRQPQISARILPGSTPEQSSAPSVESVAAAPPIPDSVPAAPPTSKERLEQESRRSSIRSTSNGSRSSKKVHFAISDSEDSLSSPDSDFSLLECPPPVALPSESKAMAMEEKPTSQAPPSGEQDQGETDSEFSSDIDDGEMVQKVVDTGTQGDNDYLYKTDWGDQDSDSGSAIDGSEPALSVPIKYDVTSRPSFAPPLVSKNDDKSSAPTISHLSSGQAAPAEQRRASSTQGPLRSGDWENDSVIGSTIDDSVPVIRVPLTSYTSGDSRPIRLRSGTVPFHIPGVSNSTLQGATSHGRPFGEGQGTANVPYRSPIHMVAGSPQIRPSSISVNRRRDRRTQDLGTDGATDDRVGEQRKSPSHAHDPVSRESQQSRCEVYYNRRTGVVTYEGLQDGYAYVTRGRGS